MPLAAQITTVIRTTVVWR